MSTDAIVLLKEDHKEIRRLFREFQAATTPSRKAAAVRRILSALTVYGYLETECVYPDLRELLPDVEKDVLEAFEEHHVAQVLCAELREMDPKDERFTAKTTVLIESVQRHMTDEERDLFPQVRKGLGRKQLQDIGARMIARRKKAPGDRKAAGKPSTNGRTAAAGQKNAVKRDAVKRDTVKRDTVKRDTVKRDTVEHNAVKRDAVEHDVVDLLIGQHTQVRDLFLDVEAASGKARVEAFRRLVRLLAVHETAEEQLVHPLARLHIEGGGDVVDDRLAEEHQAKQTLAALEEMGPDAPEFPRMLAELRISVLEHASHEEAYEFRYLRRDVPASQLRALVPLVKAAEAVAPTHPHPGVESAAANNLVGPALSLFDRTKDLVRDAITTSNR